jgi:hypothetical protein
LPLARATRVGHHDRRRRCVTENHERPRVVAPDMAAAEFARHHRRRIDARRHAARRHVERRQEAAAGIVEVERIARAGQAELFAQCVGGRGQMAVAAGAVRHDHAAQVGRLQARAFEGLPHRQRALRGHRHRRFGPTPLADSRLAHQVGGVARWLDEGGHFLGRRAAPQERQTGRGNAGGKHRHSSPHCSRLLLLQARLPRASRLSSSLLAAAHR